jgi:hypothetical protein
VLRRAVVSLSGVQIKSHLTWLFFFLFVVVGSYAAYAWEIRRGRAGIFGYSGGSALGLTFGIASLALILFAAARYFGSAERWARAHFWLGALSLPLAWFHGGFQHGAPLTSAIMWLLYVIVISGAVAALLRRFAARPARGLSAEEPIEEAIGRLAARAEQVAAIGAPTNGGVATAPRTDALKELYSLSIKPYLEQGGGTGVVASRIRATQIMRRYRAMIPDEHQSALSELEKICDDCRHLHARRRVQKWIDAWMLIHVPLTAALLILVALHAVYSLRY